MKKLFPILLCLILLIGLLTPALMPSLVSNGSTQADMPAILAVAETGQLPAVLQVRGEIEQNNLYALELWAILLTAMVVTVVARKYTIQWKISALRLYTSLKARVHGALAGGSQLKFPLVAGA